MTNEGCAWAQRVAPVHGDMLRCCRSPRAATPGTLLMLASAGVASRARELGWTAHGRTPWRVNGLRASAGPYDIDSYVFGRGSRQTFAYTLHHTPVFAILGNCKFAQFGGRSVGRTLARSLRTEISSVTVRLV